MFVKFGVVDGNKLNSSTELNIADALDDAVTTNGWRFVDWRRGPSAAGATLDLGWGALHP
jgi:hypothetical protein